VYHLGDTRSPPVQRSGSHRVYTPRRNQLGLRDGCHRETAPSNPAGERLPESEVAVYRSNETPTVIDHDHLVWTKSSASSSGTSGDCVEVANADSVVAVRDSKDPAPTLIVSGRSWRAFLHSSSGTVR
jgi:hypothetical protein